MHREAKNRRSTWCISRFFNEAGGKFAAKTGAWIYSVLSSHQSVPAAAIVIVLAPAAFDYTVYEMVMPERYARQRAGLLFTENESDRKTAEDSLNLTGA